MTADEIKKKNLIKIGFQCDKCGKIYDIDHPREDYPSSMSGRTSKDACAPADYGLYSYNWKRTMRNFTYFRIKDKWYNVKPPLVEKFLCLTLVDDAIIGHISYPSPTFVSRQVDIYTAAERLGLPCPLNNYQKKRAKTKAFVERIKK